MAIPLNTLSQSSLQDYHDCPRRFELRYLQQLAYPAIETEPALENEQHQKEGEYFHRLAQQYLIGIPSEQVGKLANTPNLQRWWENFLNSKDLLGFQNLTGHLNSENSPTTFAGSVYSLICQPVHSESQSNIVAPAGENIRPLASASHSPMPVQTRWPDTTNAPDSAVEIAAHSPRNLVGRIGRGW